MPKEGTVGFLHFRLSGPGCQSECRQGPCIFVQGQLEPVRQQRLKHQVHHLGRGGLRRSGGNIEAVERKPAWPAHYFIRVHAPRKTDQIEHGGSPQIVPSVAKNSAGHESVGIREGRAHVDIGDVERARGLSGRGAAQQRS